MLIGWYHSHPISEAKPSQNDILSQKIFQETVCKESSDEPCIGFILSMFAYIAGGYNLNHYANSVGPNHGGLHSSPVTQIELFCVVVVEQDGLKVITPAKALLKVFCFFFYFPGSSCKYGIYNTVG